MRFGILLLLPVLVFSGCIQETPETVACTEDARICPDGSAVVRIPPDCEFEACPEPEISRADAMEIAESSGCMEEGSLTDDVFYNENSKTWWIGLELFEVNELCNPACVVSEETLTAEINWRCTGALP